MTWLLVTKNKSNNNWRVQAQTEHDEITVEWEEMCMEKDIKYLIVSTEQ